LATNPAFSASWAESISPLKIMSIALAFPTALVNLMVPPHPGIVPNLISGYPNLALVPA